MPWQEQTTMTLREEFCRLASQEGANLSALCRRYGISRPTGYAWRARWQADGAAGLADRSHRPHTNPLRTDPTVEAQVLALRAAHPSWGGRKLHRRLRDLGAEAVPAPSTITDLLRRHGQLGTDAARVPARHRFEAATPNALWQLDFKGHVPLADGRLHPLVVVDDHSRLVLGLFACGDEQRATVQGHLITCFARYGLPHRLLCDHGPPWGTPLGDLTTLEGWLLRLGIEVIHGRPGHPQTQGKLERVNRTFGAEVLAGRVYADLPSAQAAFDAWRACYNHERPHEALDGAVPISRYRLSDRPYPVAVPDLVYAPGDAVRRVGATGKISYGGRRHYVSRALRGDLVAVRLVAPGQAAVYYGPKMVRQLELPHRPAPVRADNAV